jgi:putative NIF3 family GTP cyclohydrolase 1 type 2
MMQITKIILLCASVGAVAETTQPTARQIVDRIQKNVGVPWTTQTVDTFKAGNPDTPVTGIAVTMMATFDVLERAAASGKNLVITHEPTFYSHLDTTADLEHQKDDVFLRKEAFIHDHNLIVWRFHDHWHRRNPDGIQVGMVKALGWEKFQRADEPHLFTVPQTTVSQLASDAKHKLKINVLRVIGNPDMAVTHVALIPGAAGSPRPIQALERADVQALVIGETPEWETAEYVADAVSEHKQKALIILSHIPSEQAGMEECAQWLKTFISDVPIEFIPAREPFWEAHQLNN